MTCVGHEPALVLKGRLEPGEHVVEGQRKARKLVSAAGHRQRSRRIECEGGGSPPHDFDRPKRGSGKAVACDRGKEECQWAGYEELAQETVQRLIPGRKGKSNHDSSPRVFGRYRDHAPLSGRLLQREGSEDL